MVKCARCRRDVGELQSVTPDAITEELLDSIDHGEEYLSGESDIKICAECTEELERN